jgi:hypothetical protein
MTPAIATTGLTKHYGKVTALSNCTITVPGYGTVTGWMTTGPSLGLSSVACDTSGSDVSMS